MPVGLLGLPVLIHLHPDTRKRVRRRVKQNVLHDPTFWAALVVPPIVGTMLGFLITLAAYIYSESTSGSMLLWVWAGVVGVIYIPAAAMVIGTLPEHYRCALEQSGCCTVCAYDLTGIKEVDGKTRCPECGESAPLAVPGHDDV